MNKIFIFAAIIISFAAASENMNKTEENAEQAVQKYKCNYYKNVTANGVEDKDLELVFVIDKSNSKCQRIGDEGKEDLFLITNQPGAYTLLEIAEKEEVALTTISPNLSSVHSSHQNASQYYGSCEIVF